MLIFKLCHIKYYIIKLISYMLQFLHHDKPITILIKQVDCLLYFLLLISLVSILYRPNGFQVHYTLLVQHTYGLYTLFSCTALSHLSTYVVWQCVYITRIEQLSIHYLRNQGYQELYTLILPSAIYKYTHSNFWYSTKYEPIPTMPTKTQHAMDLPCDAFFEKSNSV